MESTALGGAAGITYSRSLCFESWFVSVYGPDGGKADPRLQVFRNVNGYLLFDSSDPPGLYRIDAVSSEGRNLTWSLLLEHASVQATQLCIAPGTTTTVVADLWLCLAIPSQLGATENWQVTNVAGPTREMISYSLSPEYGLSVSFQVRQWGRYRIEARNSTGQTLSWSIELTAPARLRIDAITDGSGRSVAISGYGNARTVHLEAYRWPRSGVDMELARDLGEIELDGDGNTILPLDPTLTSSSEISLCIVVSEADAARLGRESDGCFRE